MTWSGANLIFLGVVLQQFILGRVKNNDGFSEFM